MGKFVTITGGVTAPEGFSASGVHAGLKAKNPDMALIYSQTDAVTAGVFTTNKIQGAPVKLCKELLKDGSARAIVINSAIANACTGPQGMKDAVQMGQMTEDALGLNPGQALVCSTGTIGVPLPMEKIEHGIKDAFEALSSEGGGSASVAIMTTDTVNKQAAAGIVIDGVSIKIGGMAKGAGMIEPNMATMLAFLTTDANVDSDALKVCLHTVVENSFNRISIDGDQSCNDTVLMMANGEAGSSVLNAEHPDWNTFVKAVTEVAKLLAFKIVEDGEGATKFVVVNVKGALSKEDATKAVRAIANSLLVKTSWFGEDPNWGRVIDAVGYSGADIKEELIDIGYDDYFIVRNGCIAADVDIKDLEQVLAKDNFTVTVDLKMGDAEDTVYTCDCSHEYVRINSEYTT